MKLQIKRAALAGNSSNLGNSSNEKNSVINETSSNTVSSSLGSTKATTTYNGSSNNYLSSLSVQDYDFNLSFSKDRATYFITVSEDTEALTISYEAEDETATVSVYGNESLSDGLNKILISVTAENGDIRTYRIYATK